MFKSSIQIFRKRFFVFLLLAILALALGSTKVFLGHHFLIATLNRILISVAIFIAVGEYLKELMILKDGNKSIGWFLFRFVIFDVMYSVLLVVFVVFLQSIVSASLGYGTKDWTFDIVLAASMTLASLLLFAALGPWLVGPAIGTRRGFVSSARAGTSVFGYTAGRLAVPMMLNFGMSLVASNSVELGSQIYSYSNDIAIFILGLFLPYMAFVYLNILIGIAIGDGYMKLYSAPPQPSADRAPAEQGSS